MRTDWLVEIVKRSESGPYAKESDFDLDVVKRVPKLVKEFGIEFDPQTPIPSDDDMADRLYEAGLRLLTEVGVYNQSTERRIMFSRDEIEECVAAAPGRLVLGTGKDAVVMGSREVEGDQRCIIHSAPTGTPCTERYHPSILLSCAREPLVDCLGSGSVATYMGERIVPRTPTEILAARQAAGVAREAVRKAGRPGMHINDVATPITCQGKMASLDPETGLRPSDAFIVAQMIEIKTDYDQLSRVGHMLSAGVFVMDLLTPLIGGMGGGPAGTAVITIAEHLLGQVCYSASYHVFGHMGLMNVSNTDRGGLWIYALGGQALSRNTPIVMINAIYTRNGPGTTDVLWEVAAGSVASTVSGVHQGGVGCTGGSQTDRNTGLEARFNAQVSHAALGLSRKEANGLALEFLQRYEHTMPEPDIGRPFSELYDEETVEPNEGWLEQYQQVCSEVTGLGLDLDGGWRRALRNAS
ncbi:MAG: monomethylamine:corrinoid methyltransferase [Actinomycetota bacterium]